MGAWACPASLAPLPSLAFRRVVCLWVARGGVVITAATWLKPAGGQAPGALDILASLIHWAAASAHDVLLRVVVHFAGWFTEAWE